MNKTETEHIRPFYLEGHNGSLLAVYYPPAGTARPRADVLVALPFAEEMNRCRAMISTQARELTRFGMGTLVLDPYGTGDSAGEFAEASWKAWIRNMQCGIQWLRREGNGCRTVWGIRLGAIMASTLAASDPEIDRLLLWQPILEGKTFLSQFLRIRIAAEMERSGDGIKSTDELRRMAAAGEHIEVSGYRMSPTLVRELDEIRFEDPPRVADVRIAWCEVLASAETKIPPVSQKGIDRLRGAGVSVSVESVVGPAFWQLHERAVAPELVQLTNRLLASDTDSGKPARKVSDGAPGAPVRKEVTDCGGRESAVVFPCGGADLLGIVHRGGGPHARRGVVIVVAGGPQYRSGAHRQFVSLARRLSSLGFAVLRFDLRGMGDSGGDHVGFQQSGPDISAAIDTLMAAQPGLEEIVLFGECESASGILFFAYRDPRVKGIVLVNPWVRTEGGRAEVIIKHYYLGRILSPEFWRKVRSGRFNPSDSLRDLLSTCKAYSRGRRVRRLSLAVADQDISELPLPLKTAAGLRRFTGRVMILMSGHDYIAREFDEVVKSSAAWRGLLENPRTCRRDLPEADHTFSRENWKRQAAEWVCEWLDSW